MLDVSVRELNGPLEVEADKGSVVLLESSDSKVSLRFTGDGGFFKSLWPFK